ncbi:MAG: hypothetical protein IPP90_20445 [Gemmatimonadaceae bacterium]|nr:hypothetical protein [Gemmatimonadaceae bacterium]
MLKLGLPTLKEFSSTRTLLLKMHVVLPQAMSVVVPDADRPTSGKISWTVTPVSHRLRRDGAGAGLGAGGVVKGLGAHFGERVGTSADWSVPVRPAAGLWNPPPAGRAPKRCSGSAPVKSTATPGGLSSAAGQRS